MSASGGLLRWGRKASLAALLLLLGGCGALDLGVMNHAGPVAAEQWRLYKIVAVVLIFVAGPVLLLVPLIAYHYRLDNKDDAYRPNWGFSWSLEALIWLPPIAIVAGLGVLLWDATHQLDPYRALPSKQPPLEVQVVALDWKWLFIYPDDGIATVNQLAVPVGRPVHLSLTSGTVMQSLLIPQLAGQIYAMAGMRTQLNFAADRPGVYSGLNTQFNGAGFQHQKFSVVAMPDREYRHWLTRRAADGQPFDDNVLKSLMRKSAAQRPLFFSKVPPGLFEHLMMANMQKEEAIR